MEDRDLQSYQINKLKFKETYMEGAWLSVQRTGANSATLQIFHSESEALVAASKKKLQTSSHFFMTLSIVSILFPVSGKLVCKFEYFFKNFRLCTNPVMLKICQEV